MKSLLAATLLLAIGLIAGLKVLAFTGQIPAVPSAAILTAILLSATTIFFGQFLPRFKGQQFVNIYLLSIVVKLLFVLIYAVSLVLLTADASPNLMFLLLSYFLFTFLEVYFLYSKTQR